MLLEVIMIKDENFETMYDRTNTQYLREHKDGIDWFTLCCWRRFTEEELR